MTKINHEFIFQGQFNSDLAQIVQTINEKDRFKCICI